MVLVRLIIFLPLILLAGYIAFLLIAYMVDPSIANGPSETISYSYSFSDDTGSAGVFFQLMGVLLVIYLVSPLVIYVNMSLAMRRFAQKNNFRISNTPEEITRTTQIPSFRGKAWRWDVSPAFGQVGDMSFALFSRVYKEGGILRWRERRMDTIMMLELPAPLPQIVVNSRKKELVRGSNLTAKFDNSLKFQFEGLDGVHYNAYADKINRITALQVFTPDVLAAMYDALPTADIEIKGNCMWIIERHAVLDATLAQKIFEASMRIYPEVVKQIGVMGSFRQHE